MKKKLKGFKKVSVALKDVKKIFKKSLVKKIAQKCGFIVRARQLDAYEFFTSLTFGSLKAEVITLNAMVENLSQSLSREGLNKRFTEKASDFLTEILSHYLQIANQNKYNLEIKVLDLFNRINIIDGSSWKVPKGLKDAFPGFNVAGCKLQLMYDFKSGVINLLDVTKETLNDQTFSKSLGTIVQAGDLFLFDLGYSIAETLKNIDEKFGYFFSRYNHSAINLYLKIEGEYKKFDILKPLKQLKNGENISEFDCFVGTKGKETPVRLIAIKVPEEVANIRRMKLKKTAKKKNRAVKKESLELCDWTIFVTNIPVEINIDIKTLIAFYPIRWSVELFFKQFKSILKIHKTEVKTNEHRLRCEVIGKAIVAVFISYCYSKARSNLWQTSKKEISFDKTVKYFKRNIALLLDLLTGPIKKLEKYVREIIKNIILRCQKGRQKSRKNSLDVLIDGSIYENYNHENISPIRLKNLIGVS